MNAANLTRGGFYAHFKSKEALIEAILSRNAGLVRMMGERPGGNSTSLNQEALTILGEYLNPKNREEIVAGCPLATMAIDASRASPSVRAAYGERFTALIKELKRGMGKRAEDEADATALAVLAVGGVLFANASASEKEAKAIERACLKKIEQMLGADSE